jgi:5-methylcytosine-specific restriction endonuclease McrA
MQSSQQPIPPRTQTTKGREMTDQKIKSLRQMAGIPRYEANLKLAAHQNYSNLYRFLTYFVQSGCYGELEDRHFIEELRVKVLKRYSENVAWFHTNNFDDEIMSRIHLIYFSKQKPVEVVPSFEYGKISNGDSGIHWKSVGEAFNWRCHICGQETERKGGTHLIRRGSTVDHVVPQSKGGANTWNNVRPAHWECNIKKNANI